MLVIYEEWLKRKDLEYKDEVLFFAGMSTVELAGTFGTPLYVINEQLARKRYKELKTMLNSEYENNTIHFAVKANSNLAFLKILASEGSHFDCTSKGEILTCMKAGISPEKIIFTGNMFTNVDFDFAVKHGIIVNLDSISQLKRLVKAYEKNNIPASNYQVISFRINPEFGAGHHVHTITAGKNIKFGILDDQVLEAYSMAKKEGFTKFGIHMHIGSGIINAMDYEKAAIKFLSFIKQLVEELNVTFDFVDFGGGLGIPYRPEEDPLDLTLYKDSVIKPFKQFITSMNIAPPKFKIEPGRYLSAEASILIVEINTIKDNGYKMFAGVDAGFNTLVRPTMYGSYHHIIPCAKSEIQGTKIYDITGPICESGDVLGRDRELPLLSEGDYLAILDAGAYGFVMSSQYNSRPRPAEILINQGKTYIVRKAESYEDLMHNEVIPKYLE